MTVSELLEKRETLKVGDKIYLSGTVYTARDAAHKRMFSEMAQGKNPPFEIKDAFIYYAGPTPPKNNMPCGACGSTTSGRMDIYAPKLYDMGLGGTIGKGERNEEVISAIKRNKSIYLCAVGGAGALIAKAIKKMEVIAYDDLGCESVKKIEIENLPLIVAVDSLGNNIFDR